MSVDSSCATHMPGSQRAPFRNKFSSSTVGSGGQIRSSGLSSKCVYLLNHLTSPNPYFGQCISKLACAWISCHKDAL